MRLIVLTKLILLVLLTISESASACPAYPYPFNLGTERDDFSLIFIGNVVEVNTNDPMAPKVTVEVERYLRGNGEDTHSLMLSVCAAQPVLGYVGLFFVDGDSGYALHIFKLYEADWQRWLDKAEKVAAAENK